MGCKRDAPFSRRLTNETEVQVIGNEDKYMAVCRECYFKPEIESPHKSAPKTKNKRPLCEIQEEIEDSEKRTPTKRKLFKNIHSENYV